MISSQFIQSCQSGDESAIQTLVRTYQRSVFQLALSIIDDGQAAGTRNEPDNPAAVEAEAATRQTFITAIDRIGRYREGTNFETFLFGITIQVSRRRARNWKTRHWILGLLRSAWGRLTRQPAGPASLQSAPAPLLIPPAAEPAEQAAPPDPRYHAGDAVLWSSVRRLDEKLRVPVVLRFYHDFPISEIAHLLRISEGTVHARLDSAREKIAQQIER